MRSGRRRRLRTSARQPAWRRHQQAVLAKYCISCHNQRAKTGGLALDTLDLADVPNHAEEWEKVVRKVRTGAMPPVGRARPDKATAESLVTWLEGELDRAAAERANPGRPTLQRLNRSEYTNAVRDLLGVELDAASLLPADVAGYGFDNNADALTLSPALTERYLGAAAKIGQMALGRPRGLPTPETFFVPSDSNQGLRISDDLPFGSRGGVALRYYFPADGEYLFEMRPRETGVSGGFEGVTEEPHQLYVSLDKVQVWTGTIGGPEFARARGGGAGGAYSTDDRDKKVADSLRFSLQVKAGLRLVQVYFAAKTFSYQEDLFDRSIHRESYRKAEWSAEPFHCHDYGSPTGHGRCERLAKPSQGADVLPRQRRGRAARRVIRMTIWRARNRSSPHSRGVRTAGRKLTRICRCPSPRIATARSVVDSNRASRWRSAASS